MILGFSSGAAYKNIPSTSKDIVDVCANLGCNAIEIYAASGSEVEMLKKNIDKIKKEFKKFDYVSLHSPSIKFIFRNDEETRSILQVFQEAYDKFNASCLVVHPNQVEDWSVFDDFSFIIAIENMGNDVPFFNSEQLGEIFVKYPHFKMVLDVSHAYKNDPSFRLTEELMDKFGEKIVHVHLSGHKATHEPLCETNQVEIIKNIPKDLPIILESDCQRIEKMKQEYYYVKNNL